ncbi:MAG: OmpA family protein [Eubacteriales bacterium]
MAKKKQPDIPPKGSPAWMNTYGDLVTLLLCFFVLLFSMSSIDIEKFKAMISSFDEHIDLMPGGRSIEEGDLISNGINQLEDLEIYFLQRDYEEQKNDEENEERLEKAEEIASDIGEYLEKNNISDKVEITYTAQYIQLSLSGAILFDSGEADLLQEAETLIETIGDILKKYKNNKIAIEGHADNVKINTKEFPSNWYLSSARAIEVADYLMENKSFAPENISAVGFGEYRPIASNDTVEGRAKNRRVEIKVINTLE